MLRAHTRATSAASRHLLSGWPACRSSAGAWAGAVSTPPCGTRRDTLSYVMEDLWWRPEDADYIRDRASRYPGATVIEPEWTLQAAADPRGITRDPDPKSRNHAIRLIGYSPAAGFVITVIVTPGDHAGVTAWKTTGADLRAYEEQERP